MKNIFRIESKGIYRSYDGYETFIGKLTEYHQYEKERKYHAAYKGNDNSDFEYYNVRYFNIKVSSIGPA